MTSVLTQPPKVAPVTKFVYMATPAYEESETGGNRIPFPFTVENQVLDINNWSSSIDNYISNGNYETEPDYLVKMMGGLTKVKSLGPTMVTFLENYTGGTNIKLVIAPVMTRIQVSVASDYNPDQPLDEDQAINFHYDEPSGDGYIFVGSPVNSYLTSWMFKTPMTISYSDNGTTRYVTLSSYLSNN